MRPNVIEKKTNIEMLQFAFLQLAKGLEPEKHLSSILFLLVYRQTPQVGLFDIG